MEGDVRLLIGADMEIHLQLGVISAGQITWCVGRSLFCGHTHIRSKTNPFRVTLHSARKAFLDDTIVFVQWSKAVRCSVPYLAQD
jgi:hypothetical protein